MWGWEKFNLSPWTIREFDCLYFFIFFQWDHFLKPCIDLLLSWNPLMKSSRVHGFVNAGPNQQGRLTFSQVSALNREREKEREMGKNFPSRDLAIFRSIKSGLWFQEHSVLEKQWVWELTTKKCAPSHALVEDKNAGLCKFTRRLRCVQSSS